MPLWLEIAVGWSVGSAVCWTTRTTIGTVIVGGLARRQAKAMREATNEMESMLEQRKSTLSAKKVQGRKVVDDASI